MSLVSKSIPNLINGVSQQPAALRLESQGEVQENGFSDVVDGLKKRPPTKFLKKLVDSTGTVISNLDTARFHTYKRSDTEQFLVIINQSKKVYVFDVTGLLRYESGVASWDASGSQISTNSDITTYLPTSPSDITMTSVSDATFIVNKKQTVAQAASQGVLTKNERSALVYCKSVNYGRTYTLDVTSKINSNTQNQSISTPNQLTNQSGNGEVNDNKLKVSSVIVDADRLDPDNPPNEFGLRHIDNHANLSVEPSTYGEEPYFIVNADATFGDFDIKVTDDDGGVNLKAFKDNAKSFTDLPNQCEDGYILGVVGDNQKKEDDFYVKFEGTGGSGFWRECAAPNVNHGLDATKMPHQLIQKNDFSFEFAQGTWSDRVCGDDNTNAFPSFVGEKITDIFFHRNRLGVLAGENVIFSEASSYYNFFRTTVRSLLDSDPIDVAVSQNEVSELKAAVPIQDNLLLFSNLNQFTLSSSQLLTPSEVTIEQSTKYECDLTSSPVGSGTSVFFATKSGNFSGVREFVTKDDTELKDALSISSHVPQYISGSIRKMVTSPNEDMLVALTSTAKEECYIYKWYNSDTERLQSSWSKWIFKDQIRDVFFTNSVIFFVLGDGRFEKMDLTDDHTTTLLDSKITLSSGDALPTGYSAGASDTKVAVTQGGLSLGAYNHASLTADQTAELAAGNSITVGEPYTFKYQLSEQVFKPVQGDSTQLARFQLRKISFNYNNSGHFDVIVDSVGRAALTSNFTGRVLNNQQNLLDQSAVIDDGAFQVGVQAQSTQTEITITNDSHLPSIFQSAEWEGYIVLRNKRL